MSSKALDPELKALEAALKGLSASAGGLNRDELFFRAGQAAAPDKGGHIWPGVAAVMACVAAALGFALALRPATRVEQIIVRVPSPPPESAPTEVPAAAASTPAPSAEQRDARVDADYLRVREQVLRWGVESLPPATSIQRSPRGRLDEDLLLFPAGSRRPLN